MAELINQLRNSRDVYAEKLRQLLLNYQKYPQALYCVYEGEDAKYYGIRIDSLVDVDDRRQIPCKGKADVLRLYERVSADQHLSNSNTIFFVDHDFDGLRGYTQGKNLYVTPYYSIENLYIGENTLRKIFTEEYGVDNFNHEDELEVLLVLYMSLLNELTQALTTLNAWVALQREKESLTSKLNLNNRKLNKFVSISLDKVEQLYSKNDLSALFPEALEISDDELCDKITEFNRLEKKNAFRGKYFIEFLRIFLELLKADRQSQTPKYFKQKKNVKLTLSKANILSELSQYADTPSCLRLFLDGTRKSLSISNRQENQTIA